MVTPLEEAARKALLSLQSSMNRMDQFNYDAALKGRLENNPVEAIASLRSALAAQPSPPAPVLPQCVMLTKEEMHQSFVATGECSIFDEARAIQRAFAEKNGLSIASAPELPKEGK